MNKKGVLLINLGTPNSPSVEDVREYLREFLMDPFVIDAPFPIRYAIVHFFILPKRPANSAEAYKKIWTSEGSPLLVYSNRILENLKSRLSIPIALAMRYGNPSVESALHYFTDHKVDHIFVIPLFPQYAMSTFQSAVKHVESTIKKLGLNIQTTIKSPFYNDDMFIAALCQRIAEFTKNSSDHLIFSYHGLPERHIKKTDPTKSHCLQIHNCCETPSLAQKYCYRHQCLQTTKLTVQRLGITSDRYSISFQSRLGMDKWLEPSTTDVLESLAKRGVKNVLITCPSFVTDCIETLEEVAIRATETFISAGGESLKLIPCLNDHHLWIDTISTWIDDFTKNNLDSFSLPE